MQGRKRKRQDDDVGEDSEQYEKRVKVDELSESQVDSSSSEDKYDDGMNYTDEDFAAMDETARSVLCRND